METCQTGDWPLEATLGDEGAPSWDPFDQALVTQPFEGGADRDPADTKEFGEFVFGRQLLTWRPLSQVDSVSELLFDLEPQWKGAALEMPIEVTNEVIIL